MVPAHGLPCQKGAPAAPQLRSLAGGVGPALQTAGPIPSPLLPNQKTPLAAAALGCCTAGCGWHWGGGGSGREGWLIPGSPAAAPRQKANPAGSAGGKGQGPLCSLTDTDHLSPPSLTFRQGRSAALRLRFPSSRGPLGTVPPPGDTAAPRAGARRAASVRSGGTERSPTCSHSLGDAGARRGGCCFYPADRVTLAAPLRRDPGSGLEGHCHLAPIRRAPFSGRGPCHSSAHANYPARSLLAGTKHTLRTPL